MKTTTIATVLALASWASMAFAQDQEPKAESKSESTLPTPTTPSPAIPTPAQPQAVVAVIDQAGQVYIDWKVAEAQAKFCQPKAGICNGTQSIAKALVAVKNKTWKPIKK